VLAKLKEHAAQHEKEYATAYEMYKAKAYDLLKERALEVEKSNGDGDAVDLRFNLEPPDDHRQDYQRAIGMLELHINAGEETIRITPDQYAAFMQDLWGWKDAFWAKNASYGMRRDRI